MTFTVRRFLHKALVSLLALALAANHAAAIDLEVDGASETITTTETYDDINVGRTTDSSSLTVAAPGSVTSLYSLTIGEAASSNTVLVTGAGGAMSIAYKVLVGGDGAANQLRVEAGGRLTAAAELALGNADISDGNQLTVSGAGSAAQSDTLFAGLTGDDNAVTITDGGRLAIANQSYVGYFGAGNSINIAGTGTSATLGQTVLGLEGSNNSINLTDGATLETAETYIGGAAGATGVNLSGNTVTVSSAARWTAGQLTIGSSRRAATANSLSIESGGQVTVTGQTTIGGDSNDRTNSLTVTGSGSRLTAADMTVNAGNTLGVSAGSSFSATSLTLSSGATMTLGINPARSANATISGAVNLQGTFIADAAGITETGNYDLLTAGTFTGDVSTFTAANLNTASGLVGSFRFDAADKTLKFTVIGPLIVNDGVPKTISASQTNTDVIVGKDNGGQRLSIASGATLTSQTGTLGEQAGSTTNGIIVEGRWDNSGLLSVGKASVGNNLTIERGGSLTTASAILGEGAGSDGNNLVVQGAGSSLSVTGGLTVGADTSATANSFTVRNGAIMTAGSITVNAGNGMNIAGGALVSASSLTIASGATLRFGPAASPLLTVSGVATIAGSLVADATGITAPGSFDLMTAGTLSGDFSAFSAVNVDGALGLVGRFENADAGKTVRFVVATAPALTVDANEAPVIASDTTHSGVTIGKASSGQSLTVSSAATLSSTGGIIGEQATANGNAVGVNGALNISKGDLIVGKAGTMNTLEIAGGRATRVKNLTVGSDAVAVGNIVTTRNAGTSLDISGPTFIGENGALNRLYAEDASQINVNSLVIGNRAEAGHNGVTVSGASTLEAAGDIVIGGNGSRINTLVVNTAGTTTAMGNITVEAGNNIDIASASSLSAGALTLASGSFTRIGLNGAGAAPTTSINGTTSLSGTLTVLAGPVSAGTYTVLQSGRIDGTFERFTVGNLASTLAAELRYVKTAGGFDAVQVVISPTTETVLEGAVSSTIDTALTDRSLIIGQDTSGNTVNVASGGALENTTFILGRRATAGDNIATVSGTGQLNSNGAVTVGNAGSRNQLIVRDGGRVQSHTVSIGGAGGTGNAVVVTGAGSELSGIGLTVGMNGAENRLEVLAGAKVTSLQRMTLGNSAAAVNNTINVSGAGSQLNAEGYFVVGGQSTGNAVIVQDGGKANIYDLILGQTASGNDNTVTVTGSGSALSASHAYVGRVGSGNTLRATAGGTISTHRLLLGLDSGANGNMVSVDGTGSNLSVASDVTLGAVGTGNQMEVVNGARAGIAGALNVGTGNSLSVSAGSSLNAGSLILSAGATMSVGVSAASPGGIVVSGAASILGSFTAITSGLTVGSYGVMRAATLAGDLSSFTHTGLDAGLNGRFVFRGGLLSLIVEDPLLPGVLPLVVDAGEAPVIDTDVTHTSVTVGKTQPDQRLAVESGAILTSASFGMIGQESASDGNTVTIRGTWDNASGDLTVGGAGSDNALAITGGGDVMADRTFIGSSAGADGNAITVDGAGSTLVSPTAIVVGGAGGGNSFSLSNGAAASTFDLYLGDQPNGLAASANSVSVASGASLTASGTIYTGHRNAGNQMSVNNGGIVTSEYLVVGNEAGADNNTLTVAGAGSTLDSANSLVVGRSGNGNSLAITNGGAVTAAGLILGESAGTGNSVSLSGAASRLSADDVTVNGGNSVSVGKGSLLSASAFTIASGATLTIGVNGTGTSGISVTGLATISGSLIADASGIVAPGSFDLMAAASFTGDVSTFSAINLGGTGLTGSFAYDTTAGMLSFIVSGPPIGPLLVDAGEAPVIGTSVAHTEVTVGGANPGQSLTVNGGASLTSTSGMIGRDAASDGSTVTISGTWNNGTGDLTVGGSGSNNTLAITGGSVTTGDLALAAEGGTGNTVSVTGGGRLESGAALIGGGASADASGNGLIVSGAGSTWTASDDVVVGGSASFAAAGNSLRVEDGGAANIAGNLRLGQTDDDKGNVAEVSGTGARLTVSGDVMLGSVFDDTAPNRLAARDGGTVDVQGTVNVGSNSEVTAGAGSTLLAKGLTMAAESTLVVGIDDRGAAKVDIDGTAALDGHLKVDITSGTALSSTYTLLDATGISGTFADFAVFVGGLPSMVADGLDYTSTAVILRLKAALGSGEDLSGNEAAVADALNAHVNAGGTLTGGFAALYGQSGDELRGSLTDMSGEVAASGGIKTAERATSAFLNRVLDGYAAGRDGMGAEAATARVAGLDIEPTADGPAFGGVSMWGSVYGSTAELTAAEASGSHATSSDLFGMATGWDYAMGGDALIGVALAGGGTRWDLGTAGGNGESTFLQAGLYGSKRYGQSYLSLAGAYAWHGMSTRREVTVDGRDILEADFSAHSFSGRVEAGRRYGAGSTFGFTPYGAFQAQAMLLPGYEESATAGDDEFALSYDERTATAMRSELGLWADAALGGDSSFARLFGRVAWAHDWVSDASVTAAFPALGGTGFTVTGADVPDDLALVTAGAEISLSETARINASFDGEFAPDYESYAGSVALRFIW